MSDSVSTNVEALKAIRESLIAFQERIQPLQNELIQSFEKIDEELIQNYKRYERQLEERRRRGTQEGRTDSFECEKCHGRIMLKILGDTSHCREAGCNGIIHRVYRDSTYTKEQRSNDREDLEEIRRLIKNYAEEKKKLIALFVDFFSSEAGNIDARKASLARCIDLLDQYLNLDLNTYSNNPGKKNIS